MKKISLFILLIISVSTIAQDNIILKNGNEIKAKVIDISPTVIKYRKWEFQDGPIYSLRKADIFIIKYENGTTEVFKDEIPVEEDSNTSEPNYITQGFLNSTFIQVSQGERGTKRNVGVSYVATYQFNYLFNVGLGTQFNYFQYGGKRVPIYAIANINFLKGKTTPYLQCSFGKIITLGYKSSSNYVAVYSGIKIFTGNKTALYASVGYNLQQSKYKNQGSNNIDSSKLNLFGISIGVSFK